MKMLYLAQLKRDPITLLVGFVAVTITLASTNASAATYFIDYSSGSDTNNGTSVNTPWQRHPFMTGWGGKYTHQPGDSFLFRGGVHWSNAVFRMIITSSGSATAYDYYGVANTWFSGASWSQPVFDLGGMVLLPAGSSAVAVRGNNITIDNIDFSGYYWNSNSSGAGTAYISLTSSATNVMIQNCLFTNWSHDSLANGNQDTFKCIVGSTTTFLPGCVCSNCVFDGRPNGTDSGVSHYCFPVMQNCMIGNLVSGPLPNGSPCILSGCTIGPLNVSFSGSHGAGLEPIGQVGTLYCFNNVFHDCSEINIMISGITSQTGPSYIFNNIIYNSVPGGIMLKYISGTTSIAYIWNNVIDVSSSGGSYAVTSEDGTWQYLQQENNLEIGGSDGGTYATLVRDHNNCLSSTVAASYGLTPNNLYFTANLNVPIVGAATNLIAGGIISNWIQSIVPNTLLSPGAFTSDMIGKPRPPYNGATWDAGVYQVQTVVTPPSNLRPLTNSN